MNGAFDELQEQIKKLEERLKTLETDYYLLGKEGTNEGEKDPLSG